MSIIPSYLYHYTTLDTARLILKNKTIRFNNLNKTDDILESLTSDAGIAGKYIFVSCWTDEPRENIVLWNMYSRGFTGVRFKLQYNPFKDLIPYYIKSGIVRVEKTMQNDRSNNTNTYKQIIPLNHILNDKYTCLAPFQDPNKGYESCIVKYTDSESLLRPSIVKFDNGRLIYNLGDVGKYKSTEWSVQKEIRYRIHASPIKITEFLSGKYKIEPNKMIIDGIYKMLKNEDLPINYIDLFIDDTAFSNMEIMMGPKSSMKEKEEFQQYVIQYNPNCKITYSKLKLRNHI